MSGPAAEGWCIVACRLLLKPPFMAKGVGGFAGKMKSPCIPLFIHSDISRTRSKNACFTGVLKMKGRRGLMCDTIQLSPCKLTSLYCRARSSGWCFWLVDLPQMKSVVSYAFHAQIPLSRVSTSFLLFIIYTDISRRFKACAVKFQSGHLHESSDYSRQPRRLHTAADNH